MSNHRKYHRGFAVCVGGVPGVGKTTLLRAHEQKIPDDRQLTGSSVIREIIAPHGFDALDSWPLHRREEVRVESIRRLDGLRAACHGRLLVDGHFTLRNRSTGILEPVFTEQDQAFFDALVLVNCTAEVVLRWRGADGRGRPDETPQLVAEHLEAEQREGKRLARSMGVPVLVIEQIDQLERLREFGRWIDGVHGRTVAGGEDCSER
jgi:adenylate kinase